LQTFEIVYGYATGEQGEGEKRENSAAAKAEASRLSDFLRKAEYANCVGWIDAPQKALADYEDISRCCREVIAGAKPEAIVLLGMGGSTATATALCGLYESEQLRPLIVIDSTNPDTILRLETAFTPARCLFIVASKSGTTLETIALFRYFWRHCSEALGRQNAGRHFVAITDHGTPLASIAQQYSFSALFLADPSVGGRFSAFTPFGIVPLMLTGVDMLPFLQDAAQFCQKTRRSEQMAKASFLAESICQQMLSSRCANIYLRAEERLLGVAAWLEQLLAESTGKEGKGVLPIVVPYPDCSSAYEREASCGVLLRWLGKTEATLPKTIFDTTFADDERDLLLIGNYFYETSGAGNCFYFWMLVVSALGKHLAINPFDQPDVEMAKVYARQFLCDKETKIASGFVCVNETGLESALLALEHFLLNAATKASYIALVVGLDADEKNSAALAHLRDSIRNFSLRDVTINIAPRYLHTTGQFHKGGAKTGSFIFLTQQPYRDIPINLEEGGKKTSFARILEAQIAGDVAVLKNIGLPLLRLDLTVDTAIYGLDKGESARLLRLLAAGLTRSTCQG